MIGYKVVNINPSGKSYRSIIMSSEACLGYEIEKVTRPKFGFIFGFRSLETAEVFMETMKSTIFSTAILEGVYTPASKNSRIHIISPLFEYQMADAWLNNGTGFLIKDTTEHIMPVPAGTVFMRTFRPVKEVKRI